MLLFCFYLFIYFFFFFLLIMFSIYNRVIKSAPSWRLPNTKLPHTGQVSSPALCPALTSWAWSPTWDLLQLPVLLLQPLLRQLQVLPRLPRPQLPRRRKRPQRLLRKKIWALVRNLASEFWFAKSFYLNTNSYSCLLFKVSSIKQFTLILSQNKLFKKKSNIFLTSCQMRAGFVWTWLVIYRRKWWKCRSNYDIHDYYLKSSFLKLIFTKSLFFLFCLG